MTTKNTSKTWLDLAGKKCYRREYDICIKTTKTKFADLLVNRDNAIVHINDDTMAKYIKKIEQLDYKVIEKVQFDMFSSLIYITK